MFLTKKELAEMRTKDPNSPSPVVLLSLMTQGVRRSSSDIHSYKRLIVKDKMTVQIPVKIDMVSIYVNIYITVFQHINRTLRR